MVSGMKNKVINTGISEKIVREISKIKHEPKWMTDFRKTSYEKFEELLNPSFGPTPSCWSIPKVPFICIIMSASNGDSSVGSNPPSIFLTDIKMLSIISDITDLLSFSV